MAQTINQAILLGHLGADASFKTLAGGDTLANLRLATSRPYRREGGEWAEETEWHDVVVWKAERLAELRGRLRKGDRVCVTGRLRTRVWEDAEERRHQRTEVSCFPEGVILLAPAAGASAAGEADRDDGPGI